MDNGLSSDENYLGNLALLFIKPSDTDKFKNTFKNAWRSFIDDIFYKNGELTIYFRSADGGSESYFKSLHNNFPKDIFKIHISLNTDYDYEWLIDEYGEDFSIDIE